jgi:benzylsuccinate CoA-transferase BbsE subunit
VQSIQPYTGVTILDFTYELGSYATRLFADLGATVIRIESEDGAVDRKQINESTNIEARLMAANTFAFRNASKTALFFKPSNSEIIESHLYKADFIFLERGGFFAEKIDEIRKRNSKAIITYISPYGLSGPNIELEANDLTLQAAGGIAWMSGRAEVSPLRLPADQSAMITSVYAAVASAAAFFDAEQNNNGHLVDISAQECIAHSLQNALQVYDLEGRISSRNGEGTRDATEDIFPCKDGHMLLASPLALGPSWGSLVAWVKEAGHPAFDTLIQAQWLDPQWRKTSQAKLEFRKEFSDFIFRYTKAEIMEQALKRKIVMSPINNISEILDDKQLAYRDYFKKLEINSSGKTVTYPGAPYQFSEDIWSIASPPHFAA